MTISGSRMPAALTALVLAVLLVSAVVSTTPWKPLGSRAAPAPVVVTGDFTGAEQARGSAFHHDLRLPAYLGLGIGLVVTAALGLSRAGARLIETTARPFGAGWGWRLLLGALALTLVGRLVAMPFSIWSEQILRRYGLSNQNWGSWSLDQVKGLGLGLGLLLLVLPAAYGLARRWPTSWWVPVAVSAVVLTVLLSFVYPLVVEPVFNKFRPLPPGPLRTELLDLAAADGLPVRQVLVADASRRTTSLNAYVSGFGSTRRIVVYDTLVAQATPEEVRLIVAHELGHAKRNDVLHGTVLGAAGAALAVTLLYLALTSPALLRRAGADAAGDPRSLALALLVVSLLSLVSSPALNLVSRRIEARADVHSLDTTRDPLTFAESERRLALTNVSDLHPPALDYVLFASHPTAPERIAMARTWSRREGLPPPGALLDQPRLDQRRPAAPAPAVPAREPPR